MLDLRIFVLVLLKLMYLQSTSRGQVLMQQKTQLLGGLMKQVAWGWSIKTPTAKDFKTRDMAQCAP